MQTFSKLFKLYRLKAGFATLSEVSDALIEKGYDYDPSMFSHWQKGTRIPTNRHLLTKVIEIFIEKEVIKTISSANNFLASTGLGYLTKEESASLFKKTQ
jgi:hypothetical protein